EGGPPTSMSHDTLNDLVDRVAAVAARHDVVGGVFGIYSVVNGSLISPFGRLSRNSDKAITPDRRFLLTSISKVLVALQVLQLVERGDLALDVSVIEYIPEFDTGPGKRDVTTRHLLTHTSGLDLSANLVEGPRLRLSPDDYLQLSLQAGV